MELTLANFSAETFAIWPKVQERNLLADSVGVHNISKKFRTGPFEQTHPRLRNDRVSRGGSLAAGVELSPPLQKPHPRLRNDRVSRGGIGVLAGICSLYLRERFNKKRCVLMDSGVWLTVQAHALLAQAGCCVGPVDLSGVQLGCHICGMIMHCP